MTTQPPSRRPPAVGQVLPPLRDPLPVPASPLGIPLFARMQYRSEAAQVVAYTQLVDAKNNLLRALDDQRDLLERREISLVRIERLDDLRDMERMKIQNERSRLQRNAAFEDLQMRAEMEELEVRLAEAKKRRALIEGGTPEVIRPTPPTMAQKIEDVARQVDEIDSVLQARREDALKRAGGNPDQLSAKDREELERIDTLRRIVSENLYEGLT